MVSPGNLDGFVAAAKTYLEEPAKAATAGQAGRAYAKANFDLDRVADRFESVIGKALSQQAVR